MNAFDFHLSKYLISISWNPIAYRVLQAPTLREWLDHIWSSGLLVTGFKLNSLAAAPRIQFSTSADVMLHWEGAWDWILLAWRGGAGFAWSCWRNIRLGFWFCGRITFSLHFRRFSVLRIGGECSRRRWGFGLQLGELKFGLMLWCIERVLVWMRRRYWSGSDGGNAEFGCRSLFASIRCGDILHRGCRLSNWRVLPQDNNHPFWQQHFAQCVCASRGWMVLVGLVLIPISFVLRVLLRWLGPVLYRLLIGIGGRYRGIDPGILPHRANNWRLCLLWAIDSGVMSLSRGELLTGLAGNRLSLVVGWRVSSHHPILESDKRWGSGSCCLTREVIRCCLFVGWVKV